MELLRTPRRWKLPGPPGSIRSSTLVLFACACGSGLLALPYAAASVGFVVAAPLLLVAALSARWSLNMLLESSCRSGKRSLKALGEAVNPAVSFLTLFAIVINLVGVVVANVVVAGFLMVRSASVMNDH
jgi:amino acid permease